MKSFLDHLKEEVLPTVQVADGGLDISKPAVRAAINAAIAGVVSQPAVTPYVVFNRLSKLLAQYHIVLPRRFLEGDKGVEVFELKQFGHKMGMTDSGEFVNEVPATHYLFLQYGILSPFGITYAKPVVGGMFKVMARVVDKEELDKLMDMAEITMAEEAEQMQAIAKANAPKEEMHTALGDCGCNQGKSPSTKKAIKVSMKKIDEDKDPCWKGYEMIGMKKKGARKVPNCVPVKEEQLDELTGKGKLPALKAVYKGDKDYHTRGAEYHAARADRAERRGEDSKAERHMDAGYGHEHKAERAEAKSKRASALMTRAKAHADIKASKAASKSARAEYNEETQLDELKKSTLASYIKKAHVSGLEAASQGEIAYANKDKAGLRAANKTGEKREQGIERAAGKLAKEEYEKVEAGVKKRAGETHTLHRRNPGHKTEYHTITTERDGRKSVKTGSPKYIKKHWDKMEEETIAEKAPPGAKFERMVKHIKKGYGKDGLTAKEKSIAYATAWKAKNREKGE
jgi:hypothetical protein